MRTRARAPRKPRVLIRGQKVLDGITGEELYRNDSSTRRQRGMYVHRKNFDILTTQQMEEALEARLR